MDTEKKQDSLEARWVQTIVVIVLGLSVTGYFIGIQEDNENNLASIHYKDSSEMTVSYNEMSKENFKVNDSWNNHISNLKSNDFKIDNGLTKEESLDSRSKRRAYAGAPPVIPHPINQKNPGDCLACHAMGFKTSEISAPQMSHHYLTNCTQCHVEASNSFFKSKIQVKTIFEGLKEPLQGERQSDISPPTIPHSTWMRSNCMSCHGDLGKPGIQTSHPWRTNCTQCHAPSSKLDQRSFKIEK